MIGPGFPSASAVWQWPFAAKPQFFALNFPLVILFGPLVARLQGNF
jgi:hypothetical protein